ncbi:MAG: Fe-S cluster assembly protein SufD [Hyphomicrobiaceae bacterium]|nr:Fe-S cluster assembly protein SufD [Hyphomicrobiaceae bacterium]
MTLASTRTKAEQALSRSFEAVAAELPGGEAIAEARKAAIGTFAALGLPHRRIEQWKWTDLRSALKEALPPAVNERHEISAPEIDAALEELAAIDAYRMVFVDGRHAPQFSTRADIGGLGITRLAEVLRPDSSPADALVDRSIPGNEAVVALNTAFMTDGAVIRLAKGVRLDKPLLLLFARTAQEGRLVTLRNRIVLEEGAEATVIEAHLALPGAAAGHTNTLTDATLGNGARLAHLNCTLAGEGASHLATWLVTLGQACVYRAFHLTARSGLVRNNVFALFKGEAAKLDISGAFLGREVEHIDTTLLVDHAVPGCESRELFKGVLADRAHGVFQGKVIVRPNAQKSDGKQMAQALMLSPNAEFDSKPELEIHADDVVCGHGATAAEIDEGLLFYMRARGIPLAQARALLVESFIGEAIDKVEDERLRAALSQMAKRRLTGLTASQP